MGKVVNGAAGGLQGRAYLRHAPSPHPACQVACPSCNRKVAAGRFAPHLEKCMGRGRQASRNANKRLSAMDM